MGKGDGKSVTEQNLDFYTDLYRNRSTFGHLLHLLVSFDQQAKAKLNKKMIGPYIQKAKIQGTRSELSLLDFGSGWGSFLMKMPRGIKLYCFDLSAQAVQSVCRTLGFLGYDIYSIQMDGDAIRKPLELDFIVCSHVLEHVDDDRGLLKTFHSALTKDGKLLVNVPINEVWEDPKHVREYSYAGMKELLRNCGFNVLDHLEADKWTGYLLEKEFVSASPNAIRKLTLRALRLVLALMPLTWLQWSERRFIGSRPMQQLLIVASKVEQT